jgi:hypothetical protein
VIIEAKASALHGDTPLVAVDGWNVALAPLASKECEVILNTNSQVAA